MLSKNSGQVDIFNHMIFEKLIPKDYLLVKIDSIIDFSFVYEKVADRYSHIGRGSKDPVMMVKIFLLEYLYNLSDIGETKRIKTYDELHSNQNYQEAFGICYDIID